LFWAGGGEGVPSKKKTGNLHIPEKKFPSRVFGGVTLVKGKTKKKIPPPGRTERSTESTRKKAKKGNLKREKKKEPDTAANT